MSRASPLPSYSNVHQFLFIHFIIGHSGGRGTDTSSHLTLGHIPPRTTIQCARSLPAESSLLFHHVLGLQARKVHILVHKLGATTVSDLQVYIPMKAPCLSS